MKTPKNLDNKKELKILQQKIENLENKNFHLKNQNSEFEIQIGEYKAKIRKETKSKKSSKEIENYYKSILDNFTNRAKKQYKKYEAYLNKSEDLLNFTLKNESMYKDLIFELLENAILGNNFCVKNFFEKFRDLENEENVKDILNNFEKSKFFKSKILFKNVKDKVSVKNNIDFGVLQKKYDKLKNLENKKMNFSFLKRNSGNIFVPVFEKFINSLDDFNNGFKNENFFLENTQFILLINKVKDLNNNLEKYFLLFKSKIEKTNLKIEKSEITENNLSLFNSEILEINKKFDLVENLEYNKLIELRKKNNELLIIQNHVKNLKEENKELCEKLILGEFNVIEYNKIILSYEKNIKKKKEILENKKKKIIDLKNFGEQLNIEIEELVEKIFESEKNFEVEKILNEDLEAQISILKKKIDLDKKKIEVIKKKNSEKTNFLESEKKNNVILENILKEKNQSFLNICKNEKENKIIYKNKERDIKKKIKENIQREFHFYYLNK